MATIHMQQTDLEMADAPTYPEKDKQKEVAGPDLQEASSSNSPSQDRDSYREIMKAIRRGDLFKIWDLAKQNNHLFKGTSPEGNTVLHIAARYGNWLVTLILILQENEDNSSMIYKKNHKGETPLHIAAKYGNPVVLLFLVPEKQKKHEWKDPDLYFDEEGNTPLHNAVRYGNEISAEILINYDKDLITQKNKAGQSPLSIAIDARLNYIARILIRENPSPPDHEVPEQLTLLHSAVIRQDYVNSEIMFEILKQRREFIDTPDAKGRNPLHYAAASGHVKVARRLSQEKNSLVYQSDIKGQTPLHLAAKNGQPNVLKMLLKHYPDAIELTDKSGHNILHIAAQNGNGKIVSFILKLPEMVDLVNSRDKDGNTPLHLATGEFQSDVVYILSTCMHVNIRQTNNEGETALRIVETSNVKGKEIQKHLTIKALKAAYADRSLDVEDIKAQDEEHGQTPRDPEDIFIDSIFRREIEDIEGESGKGNNEMAQTLTVMNTLIATFTFTAAFTIPGGFRSSDDPDEGMAVLSKRTSFQAFVVTDTIAMTSSMTAAVIVFWSYWCRKSEFFMDSLPMAIGLTWIGLVSMILAFVTGLYVVLSDNMALAITVSAVGCTLPLIFYVFAPFISLLSNPSANLNPLAFTFSMAKIFLKKPIRWCFSLLSKTISNFKSSGFSLLSTTSSNYKSPGRFTKVMILIVGGIYYLIRALLIALSDWCFCRKSKGNESNDQTPTDLSYGCFCLKLKRNGSNDQPPTDPQTNV